MTGPYELEWKPGHPRRGAAPVQRGQLHTLGGNRAGNAVALDCAKYMSKSQAVYRVDTPVRRLAAPLRGSLSSRQLQEFQKGVDVYMCEHGERGLGSSRRR